MLIVGMGGVRAAQRATDCATPAPSDVQHFEGDSDTLTEPFIVESGVLRVSGTHQGDGNFIVVPYTPDGEMASLFNEIGPFSGEAAFEVDPGGKIILEVQADGPWTIDISPAF